MRGELAVSLADQKLYTKDQNDEIIQISDSVEVSETAPTGATIANGSLWYNSDDGEGGGRLYVYYEDADSGQWIDASPDMQISEYWQRDAGGNLSPLKPNDNIVAGANAVKLQSNGTGSFTGKVTSASTAAGDPGTTLVTKDFVDGGGGTGAIGFWNRSGTDLSPVNSGDNLDDVGSITAAGSIKTVNGQTLSLLADSAYSYLDSTGGTVFRTNGITPAAALYPSGGLFVGGGNNLVAGTPSGNIELNEDGSITAAGNIHSDGRIDIGDYPSNEGVRVSVNSITLRRDDGGQILEAYRNGTASANQTVQIKSDGSITAAGTFFANTPSNVHSVTGTNDSATKATFYGRNIGAAGSPVFSTGSATQADTCVITNTGSITASGDINCGTAFYNSVVLSKKNTLGVRPSVFITGYDSSGTSDSDLAFRLRIQNDTSNPAGSHVDKITMDYGGSITAAGDIQIGDSPYDSAGTQTGAILANSGRLTIAAPDDTSTFLSLKKTGVTGEPGVKVSILGDGSIKAEGSIESKNAVVSNRDDVTKNSLAVQLNGTSKALIRTSGTAVFGGALPSEIADQNPNIILEASDGSITAKSYNLEALSPLPA